VGTLLTVAAGSIGIIGIVLFLALKKDAAEKLVSVAMFFVALITKSSAKREELKEKLQVSLYSFTEAFQFYKNHPSLLIKPVIFAVTGWLFTLLVYLMVFYSLNYTSISIIELALVYSIASSIETATAGFPVGAVEITMISLYSALGVPIVIAGAATTLIRLLTFWLQIIVGYPILHITGLKQLLNRGFKPLEEREEPSLINA
jgi:uncharacterized protein (TIRG00374 family)